MEVIKTTFKNTTLLSLINAKARRFTPTPASNSKYKYTQISVGCLKGMFCSDTKSDYLPFVATKTRGLRDDCFVASLHCLTKLVSPGI